MRKLPTILEILQESLIGKEFTMYMSVLDSYVQVIETTNYLPIQVRILNVRDSSNIGDICHSVDIEILTGELAGTKTSTDFF
jgi:hypothetical protein